MGKERKGSERKAREGDGREGRDNACPTFICFDNFSCVLTFICFDNLSCHLRARTREDGKNFFVHFFNSGDWYIATEKFNFNVICENLCGKHFNGAQH